MAEPSHYAEWYNLAINDPYNGSYNLLFNQFDAVANLSQPAALLTLFATGADTKAAFLFLGPDYCIHVIHRIRRFTPTIGVAPAAYDNTTLATLGDLTPLGATTVEVPNNFFNRTAVITTALSANAIDAAIANNPDSTQLAVNPNEDAGNVVETRVRYGTLVPPILVGPILTAINAGALNPRDLWVNIVSPFQNQPGMGADCAPFISWCRVAYSCGVGADNPLQLAMPVPRLLEPALVQHRSQLLLQDLPHRANATGGFAPVVQVIGALRADMADRAEAAIYRDTQRRNAEGLPSKRWGAAVSVLLRICQVPEELQLPEVWQAMAKSGSKSDRQSIQFILDQEEPLLGASGLGGIAPTCGAELSKQLGRLCFQTNKDDLAAGLSIFAICHPTQDSAAKASEAAGLYDQQIQGVAGITLAETITLKAAQAFLLPVNLIEVKHVCWGYHRLLAVALGVHHPVTNSFGIFVRRLESKEITLHPYFLNNVLRCSGLLRFVHIRVFNWIHEQLFGGDDPKPAPNFVEVLEWIDEDRWTPPSLPQKYLNPSIATAPVPAAKLTMGSATTTASAPAGYFNAASAHLDKTVVPVNPNFQPKAHISAHGPPPTNDSGGLMCLSFHVRGKCKHECERGPAGGPKNDHRRHSPAESARLAEYLAKAAA